MSDAVVPPEGEAPKVDEKIDAVKDEAAAIEEKLEDPELPETERIKFEKRLDVLDDRMEELLQKIDKLSQSPVAPAPPRKVADPPATVEPATPPAEEKPKERKHRYGSARWFGDRAYDSE